MKRNVICLVLAYVLLIASNIWVKHHMLETQRGAYKSMDYIDRFYKRNGYDHLKDNYSIYSPDTANCASIAKRIEQLYKAEGPDSCRRFVQEQISLHDFDNRMAWASSQCKKWEVDFDIIDSMAIVLNP